MVKHNTKYALGIIVQLTVGMLPRWPVTNEVWSYLDQKQRRTENAEKETSPTFFYHSYQKHSHNLYGSIWNTLYSASIKYNV